MPHRLLPALLFLFAAIASLAQTNARGIRAILEPQILPPDVALFQLRDYVVRKAAPLPDISNAGQWTKTAQQTREKILRESIYHGWPGAWVTSPPKFEEVGVIQGDGYKIRKLRYEIVPGFTGAALLYEPNNLSGKVPAILNVTGHGDPGKAFEFKQKRCIAQAQSGVLALNLEWFAYGEMNDKGNAHMMAAHLDLAGASGVGLFYLGMRRGLDYLAAHPNADPNRLAVTGLSGGGWQTIVLSALDERVNVSIPVAGFSSTVTRVEDARYGDIGDFEQNGTDMLRDIDYPYLVAMRAPRPTKLIYNAEDSCCFRGPLAKPFIYEPVRRFFDIYGKESALGWYENTDPGTHNYLLDNRRQSYKFFNQHLGVNIEEGPRVAPELRSGEELTVGLPANNLTILSLAQQLAKQIKREPLPTNQAGRDAARKSLREVIRLQPYPIDRVWTIAMTKSLGVESRSHIFAMKPGLSADAVWMKPIEGPDKPPATIVLDDRGRLESAAAAAERVNRGEQVLALDLSFSGAAWKDGDVWLLQQVIQAQGERPLGIRVGELLSIARWLGDKAPTGKLRIETNGIRSQLAALTAAAVEPGLFSEIVVRDGASSLAEVYEKPIRFSEAPDLFCRDLYKETDLDRLAALASPAKVTTAPKP